MESLTIWDAILAYLSPRRPVFIANANQSHFWAWEIHHKIKKLTLNPRIQNLTKRKPRSKDPDDSPAMEVEGCEDQEIISKEEIGHFHRTGGDSN